MKTRAKKNTADKAKSPPSTSSSKLQGSLDSDRSKELPRTENGTLGPASEFSDPSQEPSPGTVEIIKILQTIVSTQEKSLKLLTSIQKAIFLSEEQISENYCAVTVEIDKLSKETKNTAEKIELVSSNLVHLQTMNSPSSTITENQISSIVNTVVEERSKELSDIFLEEKKKKTLEEQCTRVKRTIALQWTQCLNQRKKFYNNFVKNYRKAHLYSDWMESSPDFLPLKYKPKRVPGEISSYTDAKIAEARQRYKNDVNLMLEYSQIHQARVTTIDKTMHQLIESTCRNEEEASTLTHIWKDETSEQEMRAAQTWLKTERFLSRKKHEDGLRNQNTLTDTSWDETLSRRLKTRRSVQHSAMQYYCPW